MLLAFVAALMLRWSLRGPGLRASYRVFWVHLSNHFYLPLLCREFIALGDSPGRPTSRAAGGLDMNTRIVTASPLSVSSAWSAPTAQLKQALSVAIHRVSLAQGWTDTWSRFGRQADWVAAAGESRESAMSSAMRADKAVGERERNKNSENRKKY